MGISIVTTVLIPATATPPVGIYDLTDLATARDELGIANSDSSPNGRLQRYISDISFTVKNECNRTFQVQAYRDVCYIQQEPYPWQNPAGVYPLQLSAWPLVDTVPVTFTGTTNGTVNVTGVSSTAQLQVGSLVFGADGSLPDGTAIASIGVGALVLTQAPSSSVTGLSMHTGLDVRQQLGDGTSQALRYGTDYTVDPALGWLLRLDVFTGISVRWEALPTTAVYRAGFLAIPNDLSDAVIQLVTARYAAKGRDPNVVERTQAQAIGTERFWVGSQPGQRGIFPPAIQSVIDNYRVPVIA